jgi:hypothetical protein
MVKTFALLAALCGLLGAAAPAQAIDVVSSAGAPRHPDLAALPLRATLPVAPLPQLPEPEVFAMMLLGLVLIGYRASRDSDEKFK